MVSFARSASSRGQKAFQEILAELLTSTATERDTYLQKVKSFGVLSDMLPHLILLQQNLGDLWKSRMTYPLCYSYRFSGIGKKITFMVFVHLPQLSAAARSKSENMFANLIAADATYEIPLLGPSPDFVHFSNDRIGNLVMISVSIRMSWDPGGNSQLIREVVLPLTAQQALTDRLITTCNSLAHWQCTCELYLNHLGAHYTAYMFHGVTLLARVTIRFSKLWFTHPTIEKLRQSTSDKLHQLSADVHSSHRTAWGQAGFQGRGNVMPCFASWAAVDGGLVIGPKLTGCRYITGRTGTRQGDEDQFSELNSL
jgi:hypothetical protein